MPYACKMNKDPVYKKKEIKCNNITKGSWSGKTNTLLNLINHERNIDKIFYMLKIYMKQNINY